MPKSYRHLTYADRCQGRTRPLIASLILSALFLNRGPYTK